MNIDVSTLLIIWLAIAGIAALIAKARGLPPAGWFGAGLVLGPFAWLFAAISRPDGD